MKGLDNHVFTVTQTNGNNCEVIRGRSVVSSWELEINIKSSDLDTLDSIRCPKTNNINKPI